MQQTNRRFTFQASISTTANFMGRLYGLTVVELFACTIDSMMKRNGTKNPACSLNWIAVATYVMAAKYDRPIAVSINRNI